MPTVSDELRCARAPHSDQTRIVERYSLAGQDAQGRRLLQVELTMTDPGFYTEPFKATRRWAQVPNGRLLPYDAAAKLPV